MTIAEVDNSRVKSAAFALAAGWERYMNSTDKVESCLSEMRKTAIDVICKSGYADESVYDSLEKSYINNFISPEPDYEEIKKTLDALAAINTDRAVRILLLFLQGLHQKKCGGIWSRKDEQVFPWIVESLSLTKFVSKNVWNFLLVICRTEKYTMNERMQARDALIRIKSGILSAKPLA